MTYNESMKKSLPRDCPHYPNEDPSQGCKKPNESCPKGYGNDCNKKIK